MSSEKATKEADGSPAERTDEDEHEDGDEATQPATILVRANVEIELPARFLRLLAQPFRPSPASCLEDGWPAGDREFGRAVRVARQAARWNQEKLAQRAGLTEVTVRNVETARVPPTKDTRQRLIAALEHSRVRQDPRSKN
jgi:DNA-binding XRE family transcriptional regulator